MDRLRRNACCYLSLLVTLALFQPLPAWSQSPSYAGCHEIDHLLHWAHFPVLIYFSHDASNSAERRQQALAGFDEWVHATQGVVCYKLVDEEAAADLDVTIAAAVSMPKAASTLGQTVLTYKDTVLSKAVVQLVDQDDDPARFQEICAHEFGHALGIDGHSDDPDDMMYPVLCHPLLQTGNPELDWLCAPGTVTERDINTLAAAYPDVVFPSKKR